MHCQQMYKDEIKRDDGEYDKQSERNVGVVEFDECDLNKWRTIGWKDEQTMPKPASSADVWLHNLSDERSQLLGVFNSVWHNK